MGLTLREGDREYYYAALDKHFPELTNKYIKTFGNAYNLPSPNANYLMDLFKSFCKENNILYIPNDCFQYLNDFPEKNKQLCLFD